MLLHIYNDLTLAANCLFIDSNSAFIVSISVARRRSLVPAEIPCPGCCQASPRRDEQRDNVSANHKHRKVASLISVPHQNSYPATPSHCGFEVFTARSKSFDDLPDAWRKKPSYVVEGGLFVRKWEIKGFYFS